MGISTTFAYHTERIDGKEIEKPLPKELHARIQLRIALELHQRGLDVLPEINVLAGTDRLVPDLTVAVSGARFVDGDLTADQTALCVEILSPKQTLSDLFDKCERRLKAGTPLCWIIDGEKRKAWVYSASLDLAELVILPVPGAADLRLETILRGLADETYS